MHIIKNPYINRNNNKQENSKRTEENAKATKEANKIVITIIFIINGHHHHTAQLQQLCNASTDLLRGKNYNQIFVIKHQHIRKKVSLS